MTDLNNSLEIRRVGESQNLRRKWWAVGVGILLLTSLSSLSGCRSKEERMKDMSRHLSQDVKLVMRMQDIALRAIEVENERKMGYLTSTLINKHFPFTDGIDTVDLERIQEELGMRIGEEDIYIINREGEVVNSTFKDDIGLKLFEFGEEYKNFLLDVFEDGNFHVDRFSTETKTGKLKKYSYRATKDGKYVIELGVYSDVASSLVRSCKDEIARLSESNTDRGVESVTVFYGKERPVSFTDKESVIDPGNMDKYREAISNNGTVEFYADRDGKQRHVQYIYFKQEGSQLFEDGVIRIISDPSRE